MKKDINVYDLKVGEPIMDSESKEYYIIEIINNEDNDSTCFDRKVVLIPTDKLLEFNQRMTNNNQQPIEKEEYEKFLYIHSVKRGIIGEDAIERFVEEFKYSDSPPMKVFSKTIISIVFAEEKVITEKRYEFPEEDIVWGK